MRRCIPRRSHLREHVSHRSSTKRTRPKWRERRENSKSSMSGSGATPPRRSKCLRVQKRLLSPKAASRYRLRNHACTPPGRCCAVALLWARRHVQGQGLRWPAARCIASQAGRVLGADSDRSRDERRRRQVASRGCRLVRGPRGVALNTASPWGAQCPSAASAPHPPAALFGTTAAQLHLVPGGSETGRAMAKSCPVGAQSVCTGSQR